MNKIKSPGFVILAILAGILSACTLQAQPPQPTDFSADYTAAAETIIAQLTQAAPTATVIPGAGALTPAVLTPTQTQPTEVTATEPASEPGPTVEPSPTAGMTETAAATASATAAATATLPAGDPKAGLGNPTFQDTFTSAENWPLYRDEHVAFEIEDGQLRMVAFNPDFWDGWMLSWPEVEDLYIELTASPRDCAGKDQYGLTLRMQNSDQGYAGYLFGVSCDGRYSLRRWDGKTMNILIDWTASEHILTGARQTNRVGVMAKNDQLALYANGKLLAEYSDRTHQAGRFGVFVGSGSTEDFSVLVDEIAYWELP